MADDDAADAVGTVLGHPSSGRRDGSRRRGPNPADTSTADVDDGDGDSSDQVHRWPPARPPAPPSSPPPPAHNNIADSNRNRPDWTPTDTDDDHDEFGGDEFIGMPPPTPPTPLQGGEGDAGEAEHSCATDGLKLAEHAFGALTVIINLADVATDVYIAVQFHAEGETTWFWLVVASLIVAHLVYTILGTDTLPRNDEYWRWRGVSWPVRLVLSLIFAQFIPVINLIATACGYVESGDDDDAVHPYGTNNNGFGGRQGPSGGGSHDRQEQEDVSMAALEELEGARKAQVLQERMAQAAKSHLFKYGLFYVESGIESAPQAIIQLLAITFLGRASAAQLVSLCCSLFSIASKAFVISQAYQIRVMVFQFSLAAFDVFSTFYLFSTLVAQETQTQTTFFGLKVSWLTCVWLWKMITYVTLGFIGGLAVAVRRCVIRRGVNCMDEFKKRTGGFLLLAIALVAAGPLLLVAEAAKLSWITFILHQLAPDRANWSTHALLLSFLEKDDAERTRRRHVCRFIGKRYAAGSRTPDPRAHSAEVVHLQVAHHDHDQQRRLATYGIAPRPYSLPGGYHALADLADDPDAVVDEWAIRDCCSYRFRVDEATGRMRLGPGASAGAHFRDYLCSDTPWSPEKRERVILETLALIAMGIYSLGQLLSLAYIPAHAAQNAETHNILQLTCLIATGVALLLALAVAPAGYRYARHNVAFDWCSSHLTRLEDGGARAPAVMTMITEYHAPPFVECLQAAVPPSVLPVEVTGVCACFLGPRDVGGLHRLTIEQSAALKQEIADRAIVPVELAPARDDDQRRE